MKNLVKSILLWNHFQEKKKPQTEREREAGHRQREKKSERERSVTWTWDRWHSCLGRASHHRSSKDQLHPSLITDPQTPKTHRSDRQSCTDEYRLSSDLDNQLQAVLQCHRHLDRSLASRSRHHHPRPISSPLLKTNLSFPIYLYFPQSLNICLFDLWFFFFFFLLWWCGWWCFGDFCVVRWWIFCGCWWIFWYKICLEVKKMVEKMWKICKKIAFSECYQTLEIVFWTIFHCTPKRPDFNFLTGIHFPLHSFYTQNSIYIEPNAA